MKKLIICFYLFLSLHCDSERLILSDLPIGGNVVGKDKDGKEIDFHKFQEPILLVFFGYTQCPDFCPNTLMKLQKVSLDPKYIRIIFISLDPERDSPEVVQKYVSFYSPNASGLSFSKKKTEQVLRQYGAFAEYSKDGIGIDHSTYTYGLDSQRKTRILFKSTDSVEDIQKGIDALVKDSVPTK